MIKKEHTLQRLEAEIKKLEEAWTTNSPEKIKILPLYNAMTIAMDYIKQTKES